MLEPRPSLSISAERPRTRWDTTLVCTTPGETGCEVDDLVSDTPNDDGPNYGCDVGSPSCLSGTDAMVQNFMDYSDDACMNLFTAGQATRMHALFAPDGARFSLSSSLGCTPVGAESNLDVEMLAFLSQNRVHVPLPLRQLSKPKCRQPVCDVHQGAAEP